jgi:Opioid growth factor receptor (OGFr) conserved region
MSHLLDFYRGESTDTEGRFLKDIWAWNDSELEFVHDFIQWLFPLPEPSRFNHDAPLLTEEDIAAFKTDPLVQANLRKSSERILAFLGLAVDDRGKVVEGPNFAARGRDVWTYPNHNWLRITRIIRCLRLTGRQTEAAALFERLKVFFDSQRFPIPADTFRYWTEAAHC